MPYPHRKVPEEWGVGTPKPYDGLLVAKAKKRARQDLDAWEWGRQGHCTKPGSTVEAPAVGHISRESASSLSVRDFVSRFEAPNLPVLIDGVAEQWPAMQGAWEPAALFARYRHRRFRCGEDDGGYPVKMKLKYFLRYWKETRDDSPLYVFDSMYNDDKTPSTILSDYAVPPYFTEDLFSLVGEHRRPPYRWMLLGPKRSGTGVHIDPLATSAWNTLLYGRKRWVLFPPQFTKPEVKGRELVRKEAGEDDEAIGESVVCRFTSRRGVRVWKATGGGHDAHRTSPPHHLCADYFTNVLPRVKERIAQQVAAAQRGAPGVPGTTFTGQPVTWPAREPIAPLTAADPYGGLGESGARRVAEAGIGTHVTAFCPRLSLLPSAPLPPRSDRVHAVPGRDSLRPGRVVARCHEH